MVWDLLNKLATSTRPKNNWLGKFSWNIVEWKDFVRRTAVLLKTIIIKSRSRNFFIIGIIFCWLVFKMFVYAVSKCLCNNISVEACGLLLKFHDRIPTIVVQNPLNGRSTWISISKLWSDLLDPYITKTISFKDY